MIKLFVTDLDGCISYPFQTPTWKAAEAVRKLNIESRNNKLIPPLSICTGRPFSYAEAVAQWLDITHPFVFESAGLYHWDGNRIETGLENTNEQLKPIRELKKWLRDEVLPGYPNAILEFSKMMDAGIVCPDEKTVNEIYERIAQQVKKKYTGLEIHTTEVSVNTLIAGNNKLRGIELLAGHLGVSLQEIAYIGDSSGDVIALKNVKLAFAPQNARQIAKDHATVLPAETTDAVELAYRKIIEHNRKLITENV